MERKVVCDLHLISVDLDEKKNFNRGTLFASRSAM